MFNRHLNSRRGSAEPTCYVVGPSAPTISHLKAKSLIPFNIFNISPQTGPSIHPSTPISRLPPNTMYTSSSARQQSYAPTPYSYTPSSTLSAKVSLDDEIKLSTSSSERDLLDSLAEIYSIIITLEGLEKAFNKDSITDTEYTELCTRLLKQYHGNLSDERVAREFGDLEGFRGKWDVSCSKRTSEVVLFTG